MEQNENQNSMEQPGTQPAENGNQGSGRLFTQEEVNSIVKDRLARERAKSAPQEPTEEEKRMQALNARENQLACREYVLDQGLPQQLLEVLDTSNHEEFIKKAKIVSGLLAAPKAATQESAALGEIKKRVAMEKGIPPELASRLIGDSETAIYKDASTMTAIIRMIKGPAPMHDPEPDYGGYTSGFQNTKHTPRSYGCFPEE